MPLQLRSDLGADRLHLSVSLNSAHWDFGFLAVARLSHPDQLVVHLAESLFGICHLNGLEAQLCRMLRQIFLRTS